MVGSTVSDSHTANVHACRLIEKYTPLIYKVVRSMGFGGPTFQPEGLTIDDAVQAGRVGLWQASQSFDSELAADEGDPFVAYASIRIRHEVLNELRRCRWFTGPRDVRACLTGLDKAVPPIDDSVGAMINQEWLDKIDASVERMDLKRRNIFQGIMRHDDGFSKAKKGMDYRGLSASRISQLRLDIRQKLKEALH